MAIRATSKMVNIEPFEREFR